MSKPNEAQRSRLFAIAKANGWTTGDVKEFLQRRYKITSTSDLTIANYDFVCMLIGQSKPQDLK